MNSTFVLILVFAVGCLIGYLLSRLKSQEDTPTNPQDEATKLKSDYQQYQQQVGQHITKTSDLLTELQEQCQMIQEHVYSSAQLLNRHSDRDSLLQPTMDHGHFTDPAVKAAKAKHESKHEKMQS